MLHAEEPNWVGAFVGGRITIEQVTHCLVEVAFTVFFSGQQCGQLALGESERGYSVDEMGRG